jgi:hypothetical protein
MGITIPMFTNRLMRNHWNIIIRERPKPLRWINSMSRNKMLISGSGGSVRLLMNLMVSDQVRLGCVQINHKDRIEGISNPYRWV